MNGSEAGLASLCFPPAAPLAAEMYGNSRGCAGKMAAAALWLIYLLCLVILGIPALVLEFSIGRAAQTSPLFMYRKLEKPGQKWGIFGWFCLLGNIA